MNKAIEFRNQAQEFNDKANEVKRIEEEDKHRKAQEEMDAWVNTRYAWVLECAEQLSSKGQFSLSTTDDLSKYWHQFRAKLTEEGFESFYDTEEYTRNNEDDWGVITDTRVRYYVNWENAKGK